MHHPPSMGVFAHLEVSPSPCFGIFMEAPSSQHDHLLTPFLAPLPLEKGGNRLKIPSFQSQFGVSDDQPRFQEASRSPTRVLSVEQKMLLVILSLRKLQGL